MPESKDKNLVVRPPIVVVMGHIDHGKTTLLDYIRKTKVAEKETGSITQHIGAYEIELRTNLPANASMALQAGNQELRTITFIDTPGHEAFSKIRSRGAKVADIAILIIAADESVKAQTEEALEAIKESGIPFVVAINKIDKETAEPERIKNELSKKGVHLESKGGKIPSVNISAKTGQGIDELLEMILLVAEVEELKTNPEFPASGFVLESNIDPQRGIAATLLIQDGVLRQGMHAVIKKAASPIRIFEDFLSKPIKEARASSPVKVTGFNKLPEVGAEFQAFESKKDAEAAINAEPDLAHSAKVAAPATLSRSEGGLGPSQEEVGTSDVNKETSDVNAIVIPLIIKADVAGSLEALEKQIDTLKTEQISFNILRGEVGDINEDDIKLASSGENAIILGFRVKCPKTNELLAERLNVTIKSFGVIYELEDWLREEIEKRSSFAKATGDKEIIGKAKVLKIFADEKNKKIIGAEVISGKILVAKNVKILRRDFSLGKGEILELRKFQTKIEEVKEGEQFGCLIQTKTDIAPRDILEVYE